MRRIWWDTYTMVPGREMVVTQACTLWGIEEHDAFTLNAKDRSYVCEGNWH